MGVVRTDDAARTLRFVYLGPQNFNWPAASVPAYGTYGLLALTALAVTFWTRPNLGVWLFLELPLSIGLPILLTRLIFKWVTPDAPLAYQRRTLLAELRAPRPQRQGASTVTTIRRDLFTDHRGNQ